ncbi:ComF family protein [Nakamurella sp. DB0629]|uniref:ComF family protein n=1 Tax=Nakamurella aerolata TaxID=1656892 RepID=A0A849A854_9ACTN|nr:ComF family protein [Nakamurella aerolata]
MAGLGHELADLVLPRSCPGCGAAQPWCAGCARTLADRPREPMLGESTLDGFAAAAMALPQFRALARYRGPARAAVIAGKEHGRRDLPPRLGRALATGLLRLQRIGLAPPTELWLLPAPTKSTAARGRGGDPVTAMACAVARQLAATGQRVSVARTLRTGAGAADSAGLSAAARADNLAGRIKVRRSALPPPDAALVLLDDVLTTGATALASCLALAAHQRQVSLVLTVAAVPDWRRTG